MLPFGDVGAGNVRQVLIHNAWRPNKSPLRQAQLEGAGNIAFDFKTIELCEGQAATAM